MDAVEMPKNSSFYVAVQKFLDDFLCGAYIPATGIERVPQPTIGMEISNV